MIALVTGAGGFLGAKLVRRLQAEGHQVIGVDLNPPPAELAALSGVKWMTRDLTVEPLAEKEVAQVDTIFHLAGATLGAGQDEELFCRVNEATTIGLLRHCAAVVKRLVHSSSQVVYGNVNSLEIAEDFPLLGWDSPYACSKMNSENWLRWFQSRSGGCFTVLRFSGFIEGGGAVDYMINQALKGLPIELFSNGRICRDYLPVGKGIDALVAASLAPAANGFYPYNIGSGEAITTAEMAGIVIAEIGSSSSIVPLDRSAPRANFVFDISKARREFGFEPGSLAEAVKTYVRDRVKRSRDE